MDIDYKNYHTTRLIRNKKHQVVWKCLCELFFDKLVMSPTNSRVLDLGAGYGEFINHIDARHKIALDLWEGIKDFINDDVTPVIGSVELIDELLKEASLQHQSLDMVFASNLFEHLSHHQIQKILACLCDYLTVSGKLVIMQPNYKYCYKQYFDDYTHISVWTDSSLCDFLQSNGFKIEKVYPKFLPFSMKPRFPAIKWLIKLLLRCYLLSPVKPLAGQMLIIARLKS